MSEPLIVACPACHYHPTTECPVCHGQGTAPEGEVRDWYARKFGSDAGYSSSEDNAAKSRRSCGTCSACCTVMGVKELDKPVDTPCSHCAPKSSKPCLIYEARPESCRVFWCAWRCGFFADHMRPDSAGGVTTVNGRVVTVSLLPHRDLSPGFLRFLARIAVEADKGWEVYIRRGNEWMQLRPEGRTARLVSIPSPREV